MEKPIIFIGHSLGGLVIKSVGSALSHNLCPWPSTSMFLAHNAKALLSSDRARVGHLERQKSIKLSTYGILFFATPHQGAEGVSISKIVAQVRSVHSYTNTKLLGQVEYQSEWLQTLQNHYNAISADFDTVFFYEHWETKLLGPARLLVSP